MPSSFDRFRYLNNDKDSTPPANQARNIASVEYAVFADPFASPGSLIFAAADSTALAPDAFRTNTLPGEVQGILSLKIVELKMAGGAAGKSLKDWVLTSPYGDFADIDAVELVIDRPEPVGQPKIFRATARVFFTDEYYSEFIRFFEG